MKPVYHYPELFLQKMGELFWAEGHPSKKTLPEERWESSNQIANRRISIESLQENSAKLTLASEFGDIDYVRSGKMGNPILLLIPGFPDSWYTFHKILPLLSQDFDVISFSPPGHGYSTYTPLFDFRMNTYCLIVRMIIHHLQLTNVHLIGHSVGAEQAIRTILQTKATKNIQTLTLINGWGPSVFPRKTNWDFAEDITTWPIVGTELVRLFGGKLGGMQETFRKIFYRPEDRPHLQNLQGELSKPFLSGTTFHLFVNKEAAHAICEMQKEQKKINEDVRKYFQETRKKYGYLPQMPTLIIGTKYDRIFPYSYSRGLFRAIRQHNIQTYFRKIKPSGHMPAIEAPNRLSYQITNFIKKSML